MLYLADDRRRERPVRLEVISSTGKDADRVMECARALMENDHPNLLAMVDVDRVEGRVLIAMEHVAGRSLHWWLDREQEQRRIVGWFRDAANGLAAAHRVGVVHGYVSPDNILVDAGGRAIVVNFCWVEPEDCTRAREPVHRGSRPWYVAPEALCGRAQDGRSDQFGLCVAFYRAFYNQLPFVGRSAGELLRKIQQGEIRPTPGFVDVPEWLSEVIMRGLSAEPEERFSNMEELALALVPAPPRTLARWLRHAAANLFS